MEGPANKKQYGLIIPKSKEKAPVKKRLISSVFNVDSDEEEEGASAPLHLQRNAFKGIKRQAKIDIQRAMEDDPSVYQYDEIYDSMKEEKEKAKTIAKADKTSKYAKNLIRNAAVRKLENDRHFERQCQKELEDEGDEFADKESFITSSYRNKLEELAVLEAEHKRMAAEDEKNDVTKKRDLTDFYRNILSQRTSEIASKTEETIASKTEEIPEQATPKIDDTPQVSRTDDPTPKIKKPEKKRTYRARVKSRHDSTDSGHSSPESDQEESKENPGPPEGESTSPAKNLSTDNVDRDDTDSSDSEDEKEEEGPEKTMLTTEKSENAGEGEDSSEPKAVLKLSEAEQKEERMRLIRESFKRRNTDASIKEAMERYWKRKSDQSVAVS